MTQAPLIEPHSGIPFRRRSSRRAAARGSGSPAPGSQQFSLFRVNVYAFRLYVDRDAARAALADYAGYARPARVEVVQ